MPANKKDMNRRDTFAMIRKIKPIRTYRRWIVERSTVPGFRLPWIAYGADKGQYASDTLAGIKAIIRERETCNDR